MAILFLSFGLQIPLFFLMNILILFGPLLFFGLRQMKGYEPGDADWGVKLEDVRGQAEPKAEVTKVIELWSAGEEFRKAGGKPERGLLFIGAPGTGKTMLSKGIATSFNSPIVTMPGSGFAQTFIGMDVVIVMADPRRASSPASGATCVIFIDEIDAVGMRRQALQGPTTASARPTGFGAAHVQAVGLAAPTGDLILENRRWRDRMFVARRAVRGGRGGLGAVRDRIRASCSRAWAAWAAGWRSISCLCIGRRRQAAHDAQVLHQPPQHVPRRDLRDPAQGPQAAAARQPQAAAEQVYFIGATNVPSTLDPALSAPGMGRHVWFRTPTKDDRKDIFDLYLDRVSHDRTSTATNRDELARMTNRYSPAMIEQVCSMALTYAHSERAGIRPQGHRRGDDHDRVGHRGRRELHR
jgi:SpoVK/Ycf46/Vps4 family AAA+-type ATPase